MTRVRTAWGWIWRAIWLVLGLIGAATVVEDFEVLSNFVTNLFH